MRELYVFSSLRQIRNFAQNFTNELVPKAISIGDFFSKAVYVNGLNEASQSELLIYMSEACNACENANLKLFIPKEFFAFLKNNDYLFSFFKEITHQKKSINALKFSDVYAHFDEHISILSEVFENYKRILLKNGVYDSIILPQIYELNEAFLKPYELVHIQIDGFLSEFEWEVLLKVATLTRIKITFKTSKLNQKLIRKISQISNIEKFELYATYELDMSNFSLRQIRKNIQNKMVQTRAFSLSSLQAAFVFEKISTFMREGIAPERIAVILPDEKFAKILRLYDRHKMLSFAMGKDVKDTLFYALLSQITQNLQEQKIPNLQDDYFNAKNRNLRKDESFLNSSGVSAEIFSLFSQNFNQFCTFECFCEAIKRLLKLANDERISQILDEELFFLQNLLTHKKLKFSALCEFLLLRLADRSIDEVGGGTVRVMGILESRGLSYDGVIIVDFNDELVPKRSVNEMFLSSKVREKAGLISYTERENLQRFYYESLISEAKKVAISYVSDENRIASRFLSEFDCVSDESYDDEAYFALFCENREYIKDTKFLPDELNLVHDFFARPLSFSRLNTFLTCPRKYFYRYVLGLTEERSLDSISTSYYGNAVHKALFEYYATHSNFEIEPFMQILNQKGLNALELEIARHKFVNFKTSEDAHFENGWQIWQREFECKREFAGVMLEGKIDRIDKNVVGELYVVDYKSGEIPKDDLQLTFYKALIGSDCKCCFYDLKNEMKMFEKPCDLDVLHKKIDEVKNYFSASVNFEPKVGDMCKYCAFYAICRGEIS